MGVSAGGWPSGATCPDPNSSAVVRNRAPAAAARGASTPADVGSPVTTAAPASRITYSISGGGCDIASGTATPPARQMPRCTAA